MADYEADLRNHQSELIRKALKGSFFLAGANADPIANLTAANGTAPNQIIDLTPLPTAWDDLGLLTSDGVSTSGDQTSSDVTSWGYTSPTRSDIITDTTTLTVTAQETKVLTLGLYTGHDTSTLVPDPDSGEVQIPKPARPANRYYRGLLLAVDESDDGEIFIGRYFPRIKVDSKADQTFGGGDEPITWGVTMKTFVDDAAGFSERWLFGGAGWKAQLTRLGFPAP